MNPSQYEKFCVLMLFDFIDRLKMNLFNTKHYLCYPLKEKKSSKVSLRQNTDVIPFKKVKFQVDC